MGWETVYTDQNCTEMRPKNQPNGKMSIESVASFTYPASSSSNDLAETKAARRWKKLSVTTSSNAKVARRNLIFDRRWGGSNSPLFHSSSPRGTTDTKIRDAVPSLYNATDFLNKETFHFSMNFIGSF